MDSEKRCGSSNDNFSDRQKHLNEQLNLIEKSLNKHNNHKDSKVPKLEELSLKSCTRKKIKGFRGRQSIFKRPEGPAPRSNVRIIPDYRKNPTKWTCYSLDNVSDISNESNSQAAFSFLKELKARKGNAKQYKIKEKLKVHAEKMELELDDVSEDKNAEIEKFTPDNKHKNAISFRKPKKIEEPEENSKPEFRNNKIIMPEYLVGAKKSLKKKNIQKNTVVKINNSKEMKLDHLQIYEDEE